MKKLFKFSYIALFAILAVALNACTDDYEYDAPSVNNAGAYLSASKTTMAFTPDLQQTFTFNVSRHDSTTAQTIKLKSDNAKFTVPAEVAFAAGEKTKTVSVNFDIPTGSTEKLTVSVDSTDAYIYGAQALTFTIQRFNQLAGLFVSAAMEDQWDVVIYEMGNGGYRIVDCYATGKNIDFTIDSKNVVTVKEQAAWTHSKYGVVYVKGSGTYDAKEKKVSMSLEHYVSAGSFGSYDEVLYFK
jgi:hypothetical protein